MGNRFSAGFRLLTFFVLASFCGSEMAHAVQNGISDMRRIEEDNMIQGYDSISLAQRESRQTGIILDRNSEESAPQENQFNSPDSFISRVREEGSDTLPNSDAATTESVSVAFNDEPAAVAETDRFIALQVPTSMAEPISSATRPGPIPGPITGPDPVTQDYSTIKMTPPPYETQPIKAENYDEPPINTIKLEASLPYVATVDLLASIGYLTQQQEITGYASSTLSFYQNELARREADGIYVAPIPAQGAPGAATVTAEGEEVISLPAADPKIEAANEAISRALTSIDVAHFAIGVANGAESRVNEAAALVTATQALYNSAVQAQAAIPSSVTTLIDGGCDSYYVEVPANTHEIEAAGAQIVVLATQLSGARTAALSAAHELQSARTTAYTAIVQADTDREHAVTAANAAGLELPYSLQAPTNFQYPVDGGNPGAMWFLNAIGVGPDVWNSTQGNGVIVAVIDTGIDVNHPAFVGNLLAGWDFVDGDADLNHVAVHGTAVSGIINAIAPGASILPMRVLDQATDDYFEAGFSLNPFNHISDVIHTITGGPSAVWDSLSDTVQGVAHTLDDLSGGLLGQSWNEIVAITGELTTDFLMALQSMAPELMPEALNMFTNGVRMASHLDDAIRSSVEQGARVISISLGIPFINNFFNTFASSLRENVQEAVNFAVGRGAFVVAAAGNERNNPFNRPNFLWDGGVADGAWPAGLDNVITVGATQPGGAIASFSSFGNSLDIAAPGTNIYTTSFGGGYQNAGWGTSYSTPMVSAALALLISQYPGETSASILNRLTRGATDLGAPGWDPDYGNGLLNITNSLSLNPVMSTPALQIPPPDITLPPSNLNPRARVMFL